MKKKNKIILFLTTLTLLCSFRIALAGSGSTGGGHVVVCKDVDGNIKKAELLDLYEAREVFGLKLKSSLGSSEQEYLRFVKESNNVLGINRRQTNDQNLIDHYRNTITQVMKLSKNELELIHDYEQLPKLPKDCSLKQLAIFYDDVNEYVVNENLWNYLNSLNRVALFVHELEWRHSRRLGERSSVHTRNYVGAIFSKESAIIAKPIFPSGTIFCHAGNTVLENTDGTVSINWNSKDATMAIFADPQKPDMLRLHMMKFFGRSIPGIIQFQIPKLNISRENLVYELGESFSRMRVIDQDGNYEKVLSPISVVPVLYKLKITYKYGEIFKLDLIDYKGTVLQSTSVSYCFYP